MTTVNPPMSTTTTDWRAELQRLVEAYDNSKRWPYHEDALSDAVEVARAALAQSEPQEPTHEELQHFLRNQDRARLEQESPFGAPDDGSQARAARVADIRAALARWGRPAIRPALEQMERHSALSDSALRSIRESTPRYRMSVTVSTHDSAIDTRMSVIWSALDPDKEILERVSLPEQLPPLGNP